MDKPKAIRLSNKAANHIRKFVSDRRGTKMEPVANAIIEFFFDKEELFQMVALGFVPIEVNRLYADALEHLASELRAKEAKIKIVDSGANPRPVFRDKRPLKNGD